MTADRLVTELDKAFPLWGGPPLDNGLNLSRERCDTSAVTGTSGVTGSKISYISSGTPVEQRLHRSFNNRLRKECLNRSHWNQPARNRLRSAQRGRRSRPGGRRRVAAAIVVGRSW